MPPFAIALELAHFPGVLMRVKLANQTSSGNSENVAAPPGETL